VSDAFQAIDLDRWYEAELYRLRSELLLMQDASKVQEAERCLRTAIEIAREQSAKSWELRSTMSLARLLVWRPANNFLKAVESESQFFRAKAADKPSKIVKLFAGRDTRKAGPPRRSGHDAR
jgi:hypothetical protein